MQQAITINRDCRADLEFPLIHLHLRFDFRVRDGFVLPSYNASAWRGAFGHALRHSACVTGQSRCVGCSLLEHCVYAYLFETRPPPDSDRMRRYTAVPHPFVFRNQPGAGHLHPGKMTSVELLLFGRAVEHLPWVLYALRQAGATGLTRRRARLRLERAVALSEAGGPRQLWSAEEPQLATCDASPMDIPPVPTQPLELELVTPLRLLRHQRLIEPRAFRPVDLLRSLTRRLSMLGYFHGGFDAALRTDFAELHQRMTEDWLTADFHVQAWKRYSSRQQKPIKLPGLVGQARIDFQRIPQAWPWFWLGQQVHAGKAASLGLGQYRLHLPGAGKLAAAPLQ